MTSDINFGDHPQERAGVRVRARGDGASAGDAPVRAARSGPPGEPAAFGRQGGGRRSQLELRRRESCPDASRIVRLAAFCKSQR